MLKNVIVVNDFDYVQGGASKVAIQTANMLVESNERLKVYFFSAVHSEESTLDKRVMRVCTNQSESLNSKLTGSINNIYNVRAKRAFKQLLKSLNKKETVIHVHGWTKALSSSVLHIAFKMKFKVVLTMHDYFTACPNGGYFNYKKNEICYLKPLSWKCIKCNCDSRNYAFKAYRIIRQFVQNKIVKLNDNLTDVISISEFSEKILKQTLNKNVKIHRVYNPIDLDSKSKKVDYKKNKYFLYVGRISKEKGVDIFCDGITKANKKGIVVGDGDQKEYLEKTYPNIQFVGWKSSDKVKKYMQGAKALIIPSRWYEGAPLTPLEALQYGIPIISSDCNASVDYINKENGVCFNIENDELQDVINNLSDGYNPKLIIKNDYIERVMKVYNLL